jgi:hypothetical protein
MKRAPVIFIIIGLVAVFVLAFWALDDLVRIPPRGLTATRMWGIKRRILEFAVSHNQLPRSLDNLPIMQGYDNSISDEWGRPITYKFSPLGLVTLTSLGRDGKVGGFGIDADMVATFSSHDGQGRWCDELIDWIHNPFSQ